MEQRRIGIIGYGHLGQFLRNELTKSGNHPLDVVRIWNRTEEEKENVLPLSDLTAESLHDIDLVVEVAHPDVVKKYATLILEHADLFIGSPSSLADKSTHYSIQEALKRNPRRSVFIPSGALWGAKDIQKMADLGLLKALTVMMVKHPNSLKVTGPLVELCQRAKKSGAPVVIYDGPVRLLCPMAPNNVNTMACAAIAAHNLGFDNTRAKLIADPKLTNWHIVEYEILGENGFRTTVRRENPAQLGAVTGENTYFSFLSSLRGGAHQKILRFCASRILQFSETLYKPPGFNMC